MHHIGAQSGPQFECGIENKDQVHQTQGSLIYHRDEKEREKKDWYRPTVDRYQNETDKLKDLFL